MGSLLLPGKQIIYREMQKFPLLQRGFASVPAGTGSFAKGQERKSLPGFFLPVTSNGRSQSGGRTPLQWVNKAPQAGVGNDQFKHLNGAFKVSHTHLYVSVCVLTGAGMNGQTGGGGVLTCPVIIPR